MELRKNVSTIDKISLLARQHYYIYIYYIYILYIYIYIYYIYIYYIIYIIYITVYVGFWMVSVCFGSICSWGWSKTTQLRGTTLRCDLGIFSEAMFRWFLLLRSRSMELTQGSCLQFYNNHVISLCKGLRSINTHHPPFMGGNSGTPLADPFLDMHGMYRNHPIQGHMLHYFTWCLSWKDLWGSFSLFGIVRAQHPKASHHLSTW